MATLETDRLVLRRFCQDDWSSLLALAIGYQASEASRYEDPWPTSEDEVKGMAGWFAGRDDFFAVCLRETGGLIGLIAIDQREGHGGRVRNLGYVFHPDYHGQGYATEACQAAIAYLFGTLRADGILTGTHPANEPSIRLLRRLGFTEIVPGEHALSQADWLASGREP